jgi:TraB/PrgY/gumN family
MRVLCSILLMSAALAAVPLSLAQSAPAQPAARPAPAVAQPPATDEEFATVEIPADAVNLDTIVVTGRQPGPGLWKVSRGENVMWILGTQNPLPKRMQWDSENVEARVARADEVLLGPTVDLEADIGFFRRLTLIPTLFRARKNPDGRTLSEILPAEEYARWRVLKQRYIGKNEDIEEWRPVFAALELYNEAIEDSGMSQKPVISDVVERAAKRGKVKLTTPTLKLKLTDTKAVVREFASTALDDRECFRRTMVRIETDLGNMAARANAWAEGDIEALRALPGRDQLTACTEVFTGTAIARKQGIANIRQQVEALWMREAEAALGRNRSTFAVLPLSQLVSADGYLAKLAAKGYVIEEP